MADPDLTKKIADVLKDDRAAAPTAYDQVVGKLRDLAAAIEASLTPGAGIIEVRVEPGHRVNLGQQFSLAFRIPKIGFRDVLLRAYVPPSGFPVVLDLFDDERRECESLDDLERDIIAFLGKPDVKQRLLSFKDVAA